MPVPSTPGPEFAPTQTIQPTHLVTIDAMRGIAALSVCLFHFGGSGLVKLATPITSAATGWGVHGVDIFFVISGFVIPYVLLRSGYRWRSAPRFLARRFLRVGPPAYMVLVAAIAQYWLIDRLTGGNRWFSQLTGQQLLANIAFIVPFTGEKWINGVFWTLAVEFQYYLILALVYPLLSRSLATAIGVATALCIASALTADFTSFFSFTGCFFLGGIVLAYRERAISRQVFYGLMILALILVYAQEGLRSVVVTAASAILLGFVRIDNQALNFLGKISYSLYLTHILAGSSTEYILMKFVSPGNLASRVALQAVCIASALIAATLFYYLVERHFVTLSQKVRSGPPSVRGVSNFGSIVSTEESVAP